MTSLLAIKVVFRSIGSNSKNCFSKDKSLFCLLENLWKHYLDFTYFDDFFMFSFMRVQLPHLAELFKIFRGFDQNSYFKLHFSPSTFTYFWVLCHFSRLPLLPTYKKYFAHLRSFFFKNIFNLNFFHKILKPHCLQYAFLILKTKTTLSPPEISILSVYEASKIT